VTDDSSRLIEDIIEIAHAVRPPSVIDAENLKKFGNPTAVEDLTLHVDEGDVFGFLGPNGAGKTTTVRMLCCLISITSGKAKIGVYEVGNSADSQKIRRIIGLLPENVGLYDDLSAYKNLDFYGRLYKCTEEQRRERIEYFLKMLGLWDKRNLSAGTFQRHEAKTCYSPRPDP